MPKPTPGSYPSYAANYINLVDAENIKEALEKYSNTVADFFKSISGDKIDYRYDENKWTIKEMLQHLIDAERVFAYRAMCVARKDQTSFPGFDENSYAANSKADRRSWEDLLEEFELTRKSTDLMLLSFDDEQLQQTGITNNSANNVNAIAFTLYGHLLHHIKILDERYLNK
ncbi:MAG: hypothetical protein JWQ96_690 [Segetibacter sp.]|nr:hypothetical protein [Segetibacter sp.]